MSPCRPLPADFIKKHVILTSGLGNAIILYITTQYARTDMKLNLNPFCVDDNVSK